MADDPDNKTARIRIEEAIREIGVLMVALAPLDAAFSGYTRDALANLLIFVTMGATLFLFALWLERGRRNVGSHR